MKLPEIVEDFLSVTPDAARILVGRGVLLVGIGYLSIAAYEDPAPTHEALFDAGVTVVETLDLLAVERVVDAHPPAPCASHTPTAPRRAPC